LFRRLALGVAVLISVIIATVAITAYLQVEPSDGVHPPEVPDKGGGTNRTVMMGLIAGSNSSAPRLLYAAKRGLDEVNAHCQTLGLPWRFDIVEYIAPDPLTQTEVIQNLNAEGVKIMFCEWNSPICSFQTYITLHNITMIGVPDSHCRSHKQIDSVYRMSPNTTEETEALAETLRANGVKAVIVLRDSYSYEYLSTILPREGTDFEEVMEIIHDHTEAEPSVWQDQDAERSRAFMDEVNTKLNELLQRYEPSEVGVVYSFSYVNENLVKEIASHGELQSVTWYTTPLYYANQTLMLSHSDVFAKIHFLSLSLSKPGGDEYLFLEEGYEGSSLYTFDGVPLGSKEAALYDAVKVASLAVIESGSTQGEDLQSEISIVATNYVGATGNMALDANGDRMGSDFDIYGYYDVGGSIQWVIAGHYDSKTGETELFS